jgi:hypothetical protein
MQSFYHQFFKSIAANARQCQLIVHPTRPIFWQL